MPTDAPPKSPSAAPLVSVILPAFRAGATVARAVTSALAGGIPEDRLEILLESDDGHDYAQAASLSPAVRVAVSGAVGSGVGPARNRAMARARGEWLTYLDADDAFAPGALAALVQAAVPEGAAIAPMQIHQGDRLLLDLWSGGGDLTLAELSRTGASLRPMVARDRCPPFVDALSQDILHGVELMAAHGGRLPLAAKGYRMHLSEQGITGAEDFSARVHTAYLAHITRLESSALPPEMARAAADVFRAKIELNRAYQAEGRGRSYYHFIADRLEPP